MDLAALALREATRLTSARERKAAWKCGATVVYPTHVTRLRSRPRRATVRRERTAALWCTTPLQRNAGRRQTEGRDHALPMRSVFPPL